MNNISKMIGGDLYLFANITEKELIEESEKYCNHIDFSKDNSLSEKGRERVKEWSKQDFINGAKYIIENLGLKIIE